MGDFTNEITCACQKLGAKAAPQTFDTHMTFCKARPLSETYEKLPRVSFYTRTYFADCKTLQRHKSSKKCKADFLENHYFY